MWKHIISNKKCLHDAKELYGPPGIALPVSKWGKSEADV